MNRQQRLLAMRVACSSEWPQSLPCHAAAASSAPNDRIAEAICVASRAVPVSLGTRNAKSQCASKLDLPPTLPQPLAAATAARVAASKELHRNQLAVLGARLGYTCSAAGLEGRAKLALRKERTPLGHDVSPTRFPYCAHSFGFGQRSEAIIASLIPSAEPSS